jgi:hypothetical protein
MYIASVVKRLRWSALETVLPISRPEDAPRAFITVMHHAVRGRLFSHHASRPSSGLQVRGAPSSEQTQALVSQEVFVSTPS